MAQEFLQGMKSRNSGHIVAISSMSALVGLGFGTAYTASKCGVMGECVFETLYFFLIRPY